jgi:hypothetical protein
LARETVSVSGGASLVSVVPAPSVAPRPTRHRRDQLGVGADEGIVLDDRLELVGAVVVAGDRAGADVDAAADRRVADVGQMVGLGLRGDRAVLDLDEVADMHVLGQHGARAQAGIGADTQAGPTTASSIWLKAAMRVPAPMRRSSARSWGRFDASRARPCPSNTQLTSMNTSRPQTSSPRTSMRAGSARRTPCFHQVRRQCCAA